jgi:hypothetical protein
LALVQTAIGSATGAGPLAAALIAIANETSASAARGVGYAAIFRPMQPSSGNAFQTEAELLAAIADIESPRVGVDLSNGAVPPVPYVLTQSWNLRRGSLFSVYPITGTFELQVPEGVQITDLTTIEFGLSVRFNRTLTPGLVSTLPPGVTVVLALFGGAVTHSDGPRSVVDVPPGETFVLSLTQSSAVFSTGKSFVGGLGGQIIGVCNTSSVAINAGFQQDWADGIGGTNLGYIADSSFTEPTLAAYAGSQNPTTFTDNALAVTYPGFDDPVNTWVQNPTNIREALGYVAVAVAGLLGGPIPD